MLQHVLDFYRYHVDLNSLRIQALGNAGGFSGAQLWKIEQLGQPNSDSFCDHRSNENRPSENRIAGIANDSDRVSYCLRRWPKGVDLDRLRQIHHVLSLADDAGCRLIPVPLSAESAQQPSTTLVKHEGSLWQLEPWIEGQPDQSEKISEARLVSAAQSLAKFHASVDACLSSQMACCPAIAERKIQMERLLSGELNSILSSSIRRPRKDCLPSVAILTNIEESFERIGQNLLRKLRQFENTKVRISPSIRDTRREHFLFVDDRVSGIIDFGAMRNDSRAVDASRMLGDFCGNESADQKAKWQLGLEAYLEVSRLDEMECALLPIFDRSSVMLSLANWLRWLHVDQKEFENPSQVAERIAKVLQRFLDLAQFEI